MRRTTVSSAAAYRIRERGQMRRHADREAARTQAALTEQRDQAKDDAASTRSRAIVGLIMGTLGWSLAVPPS